MILTVKYFAGSLTSYKKERLCAAEIAPTRILKVEWPNKPGYKEPVIPLVVPEWGVKSFRARKTFWDAAIAFIPDSSGILAKLLDSGVNILSERLFYRIEGNNNIEFVKRPSVDTQDRFFQYPHIQTGCRLDQITLEGPRVENGFIFTSRVSFSFL